MNQKIVYIGVDDTDVLGGPAGTGRVARGMAEYLENLGLGNTTGVIRLQLLVDPRIPYTSHNSAKCIEFMAGCALNHLHQAGIKYLKEHFQEGSDPGLCTCGREQVSPELIDYGTKAQREYIEKQEAIRFAETSRILLSEVAGTGDGIIGALAAAGLRGGGNEGRYVQLRGINDIKGLITVEELLSATNIAAVTDENGLPVTGREVIDSQDWIKPNIISGKPVLRIRLKNDEGGRRIWETVEQKHKKHA